MKIAVFTSIYMEQPLGEALDRVKAKGIDAVELSTGSLLGKNHCDPELLLSDPTALKRFCEEFEQRGMTVACLSCHGNPLHPVKSIAQTVDAEIRSSIKLAEKIGVDRVVTFSGCPGENDNATIPYWANNKNTADIWNWQWNEKCIPYWCEIGEIAQKSGVKIALETDGGYLVYSPYTAAKLCENTPESIGINVDPSNLWRVGVDPVEAIRYIGETGRLYHFHVKDTQIHKVNLALNGLFDTKPPKFMATRSNHFRTIGFGHPIKDWADMVSMLRVVGYDSYLSIEHEDSFMSIEEGVEKGINNLRSIIMEENPFVSKIYSV